MSRRLGKVQHRFMAIVAALTVVLLLLVGHTVPVSATTIKTATFESGSVTGTNGVDSATATLETTHPLYGSYAAYTGTGQRLIVNSATPEQFVAVLIDVKTIPTLTRGIINVAQSNSGSLSVNLAASISLTQYGYFKLKIAGNSQVGSVCPLAVTTGTTYRIGLGLLNNEIRAYCASGNSNFSSPFASTTIAQTDWSDIVAMWLGATGSSIPADYIFDNVQLDDAAMPSAITAAPTATATNTAVPPTATPVPPTATPSTTVGNIATFEGNSATGSLGFNSVSATAPAVVTGLAGSYGVQVNSTGTSQYGLIGSSGVHPDVYVSFLYRLDATPTATTPFFFVGPTGSTNEVKLSVGTDNKIRMVYEGVSATGFSSALTVGSTYRVGLHIHEDTTAGTTLVESYLASGNSAFGTAFNSTTEPKAFSGDEPFTFGTTTKALSSSYDNIQIDTSAMPSPLP